MFQESIRSTQWEIQHQKQHVKHPGLNTDSLQPWLQVLVKVIFSSPTLQQCLPFFFTVDCIFFLLVKYIAYIAPTMDQPLHPSANYCISIVSDGLSGVARGQSATPDSEKFVKNREKRGKSEKRGKIGKKRQKSGRFFQFAPPDR